VLKKPDTALKAYARCLELQPSHPNLCANFGGVLAQLGRNEEAEKIYRQGLVANPDSCLLNYNLGILLWNQGDRDEGRKYILRSKELGMKLSPEINEAIAN